MNLTKFEKRELRQMSKKVGLTMSAFVRECIFKKFLDSIKIQIIESGGVGIERIRKPKGYIDPLQAQMKKEFQEVVNEIKQGFKEQRQFLKKIPQKELNDIKQHKKERLKEIGIEL